MRYTPGKVVILARLLMNTQISMDEVDRTGISHHEKMVSQADRLLYMAKAAGRNRVCG